MSKYISLVLGLIAMGYFVNSFLTDPFQADLFGFEVKIWTFRIFWLVVSLILFFSFYKKMKESK